MPGNYHHISESLFFRLFQRLLAFFVGRYRMKCTRALRSLSIVIFGLAFGGVRIVAKKFFPDRVFDRPEDVEVIRLNLK